MADRICRMPTHVLARASASRPLVRSRSHNSLVADALAGPTAGLMQKEPSRSLRVSPSA
jgi:hypothetical protein